jgi:hypothetical protein
MMKSIVAATLLMASSPAFAQSQTAAQPAQQPQQAQPQQAPQTGGIVFEDEVPAAKARARVICQDITEPGSRLSSQRICMTAEQWKQQQEHDRALLADTQRQISNTGRPSN